jgi:hypothetical protein
MELPPGVGRRRIRRPARRQWATASFGSSGGTSARILFVACNSSSHNPSVGHRPQAAVDFAFQLARAPADIADEIARLVRRGLDDVIDGVRPEREIQILLQQHRAAAGGAVGLHQSHQSAARKRATVEHRLHHFLRRLVLGEQTAKGAPRGAIEDHADMPAVRRRRRNQHGLAIFQVAERGVRDQHDCVVRRLRAHESGKKEQKNQNCPTKNAGHEVSIPAGSTGQPAPRFSCFFMNERATAVAFRAMATTATTARTPRPAPGRRWRPPSLRP